MNESEATGDALTATDDVPRGLAPLALGDPASPVLTLVDGRTERNVPDVDVLTAWRTVRLGRDGAKQMHDWLARYLATEPQDEEPELWTATGIAKETGFNRRTVHGWIEQDDFPKPFATPVGGYACWEADKIRYWLRTRELGRRGRPKAIRP